tara:strand:+ start:22787 stop:24022 length:1236 start_codon:yes stop_codon:yes gene_type:complete
MYQKAKNVIKDNKKIIENFSYLSVLQLFNLVLPLITYPYLIRILGADIYGSIAFAQAVIGYFAIVVNFGFNISATKNISVSKNDKNKISEITSSVLIIKLLLFIFCFFLIFLLINFINTSKLSNLLFYYTMYLCLYEAVFPVWYFQGKEKMKYITILNLFSRLLFVVLIFIVVKSQKDYLLVPIINGLGTLIIGIISFYIIFKIHGIRFRWQKTNTLIYYVQDSLALFASNAMVMVKEKTNIVFIGFFLNMTDVAYYDLILKISTLLRTPFMVIREAIFPNIVVTQNYQKYIKISVLGSILSFFVYVLFIIFDENIVKLLGGTSMLASTEFSSLMGLIIPLGVISMYLGTGLIIFKSAKIYSLSIFFSLISFILGLLSIYLYNLFSIESFIIVLLFSLIIEIISRAYYLKK